MDYAEARRQARKLLGEKGEVRKLSGANGKPVPVYPFVVGLMQSGKFHPLEAGGTWLECLRKLEERMEKNKS